MNYDITINSIINMMEEIKIKLEEKERHIKQLEHSISVYEKLLGGVVENRCKGGKIGDCC